MEKVIAWLRENWLLVLILAIGAFLRLYRIGDYMTFLGDEGRDLIIVRRLLVNFDPILIGPGTSIGQMYLGPIYYYMIAPFLWLANFSPVGPAVFIALLGVATIYFVYHVGKEWFGRLAGWTAAALYAVSPTVIIHSHSSWNPNIMPFFSLLTIYGLWKVWSKKKYKWLIVLGASFAIVLQSHYLGVLMLPVIILFLVKSRPPAYYLLRATLLFAIFMSPLLLFDLRHNFMNLKALKVFLFESDGSFSFNFLGNLWLNFKLVVTRLIAGRNVFAGTALAVSFVFAVIYGFYKKFHLRNPSYYLLLSWLGIGILGLSFYRNEIYDHYFGFLFPAAYLFFAGLTQLFLDKFKGYGRLIVIAVVAILLAVNLAANPFLRPGNKQLQRAIEVSAKIGQEAKGNPFNIAVVAERNYEDGYQYFLEKEGRPVVEIDAQLPNTVTDQLFVICEKLPEECDPTHSSKAEVANFGWSKIEAEWEVMGVTIYKLVHTK